MTSITMSKRHRQPVTEDDLHRQSDVFAGPSTPELAPQPRKHAFTLHLPHRRDTFGTARPDPTQLSLLDTEPGT